MESHSLCNQNTPLVETELDYTLGSFQSCFVQFFSVQRSSPEAGHRIENSRIEQIDGRQHEGQTDRLCRR